MKSELPQISPAGRYSVGRTMEILGVSRSTFYRYINSGMLHGERRASNNRLTVKGTEILKLWNMTI